LPKKETLQHSIPVTAWKTAEVLIVASWAGLKQDLKKSNWLRVNSNQLAILHQCIYACTTGMKQGQESVIRRVYYHHIYHRRVYIQVYIQRKECHHVF
jgi:hypothetical protein